HFRLSGASERLNTVALSLAPTYTPAPATHHVAYSAGASRLAFVGDTAGICRGFGTYVMPPTPPPDIDLDAWRRSSQKILAWEPDTLFLTHFGPKHGARQHLQAMFENIDAWSRIVRRLLADASIDDAERQRRFVDEAYLEIQRRTGETEAADYVRAGGLNYSWQGLARYWRKRAGVS